MCVRVNLSAVLIQFSFISFTMSLGFDFKILSFSLVLVMFFPLTKLLVSHWLIQVNLDVGHEISICVLTASQVQLIDTRAKRSEVKLTMIKAFIS